MEVINIDIINNSVLKLLYEHRYIFAFLGALFEGTFIMILSGVLLRFGYFNFFDLIVVLIVGYFLNGLLWFVLGRIAGHTIVDKWIKHFKTGKRFADKIEGYFKEHSYRTIFLTRITYGISMFSFMIAGSLKMNWKKFITISLLATVGWVLLVGGIGYGFGASIQSLSSVTKGVTIGISLTIIAVMILFALSIVYWLRYFARTKFVQELENHDSIILSKIGETIRKSFHHKKNDKETFDK
ncbi:MAG: DedA family protein [Patescibacteria group bacterium]